MQYEMSEQTTKYQYSIRSNYLELDWENSVQDIHIMKFVNVFTHSIFALTIYCSQT